MKLAVIVPVYRVEPYLRQCIESILNQSYRDLRVILVDDGSPDASGAICEEYAQRDERVIVLHKENGGQSSARNLGLKHIDGCDYVTFLDSDDWLEGNTYERCIRHLEEHPEVSIVGYGYNMVYPDHVHPLIPSQETLTREEALRLFLSCKSPIVGALIWSRVYRLSALAGLSFPEGRLWEDVSYTLEVLWQSSGSYALLPIAGLNYRVQRPGAATESRLLDQRDLFLSLESLIDRRGEDRDFLTYANTLELSYLWLQFKRITWERVLFDTLSSDYLAFLRKVQSRPYISVFSSRWERLRHYWLYRHPLSLLRLRLLVRELFHRHK